jgi:hypothetical protein
MGLKMPFLTDLDSRAAVKGSRDPLGIQQIWTRLGRHVVGNLTTVSTSVRDFGTLLLGYHFAERLADDLGPGRELATFIKWEQLAAYARASCNNDYSFRGTEKVRRILDEGGRVYLSDDRSHQILASQKMYGLWGLYTVPARTSWMLEGEPARLTTAGRAIVEEHYLPRMGGAQGRHVNRICDLLKQKQAKLDVGKGDAGLVQAVAHALPQKLTQGERGFFREFLLDGGPEDPTNGRQRQFASLVRETLSDDAWRFSPPAIRHFAKQARSRGEEWEPLAHRLERIATCETVMGPAAMLFSYLLGLDEKAVATASERLKATWGPSIRTVDAESFRDLQPEISSGDASLGDRWMAVAEGFAQGDYDSAIAALMQQNKHVMGGRGGAAWIELRGGRFHVRMRDEHGRLPDRDQLPELWRFPYFLDSVRTVALALGDGGDE